MHNLHIGIVTDVTCIVHKSGSTMQTRHKAHVFLNCCEIMKIMKNKYLWMGEVNYENNEKEILMNVGGKLWK